MRADMSRRSKKKKNLCAAAVEEAVGLRLRLHAFLDSKGSVETPPALLRRISRLS